MDRIRRTLSSPTTVRAHPYLSALHGSYQGNIHLFRYISNPQRAVLQSKLVRATCRASIVSMTNIYCRGLIAAEVLLPEVQNPIDNTQPHAQNLRRLAQSHARSASARPLPPPPPGTPDSKLSSSTLSSICRKVHTRGQRPRHKRFLLR